MSQTNYWEQIEEAFENVDIYETPEVFKQGAAKYPEWKIDLLAVHWTMSEIVNGGLMQYFENSTAVLAPDAVVGFERIGMPDLANTLKSAMSLLGEVYPRERELRSERLAALTGRKPGESQGFSVIPKWVGGKTGMKSGDEAPSPFSESDDVLAPAWDAVEAAMDAYAIAKTS